MSTIGAARGATSSLAALVLATFGIATVHAANPAVTGAVVADDTADNDGTGLAVEGSLDTQLTGNTLRNNGYGIVNAPFTFFATASQTCVH